MNHKIKCFIYIYIYINLLNTIIKHIFNFLSSFFLYKNFTLPIDKNNHFQKIRMEKKNNKLIFHY